MRLIGDAWRVAALGASAGVEWRSSDLPLISRYDAVISITMFRRLWLGLGGVLGARRARPREDLARNEALSLYFFFFVTFPIACLLYVAKRAARRTQGIRVWAAWLCWMRGRDLDRAGVG